METQGHDVSRSWILRKLYYEAISGALDRSRTCDPPLRRRMLYPTELPRQGGDINRIIP